MKVADIGEFGLIELLAREIGVSYPAEPGIAPRPGLLVDIGDDAVVSARRAAATIWTTDTMVAGVHFILDRSSWRDIGWKALAVNLSDVGAMGGTPDLALVTLCLPPEFLVDDAVDLYRGLNEAALVFGVTVAGGDVVRAPVFSVTVALSGIAESADARPQVMTRSTARPGDVVAVSGSPGDSAAGLCLLREGHQGGSEAKRRLLLAHNRPQPRVALGKAALRSGVRCAIDVSDGLVQDLRHVARASGVSIRVDATRVPISAELREVFPDDALSLALSGGEDYELLLVGSPEVIRSIGAADVMITKIGEVTGRQQPGEVVVLDEAGQELPLVAAGWDHLKAT